MTSRSIKEIDGVFVAHVASHRVPADLRPPDERVHRLTSLFDFVTAPNPMRRHHFSLLRFLGFLSLLVNVRGQRDKPFHAHLDLLKLHGPDGFALNGKGPSERTGYSISGAGDVNADGIADAIVGVYYGTPTPSRSRAGGAYVVFGSTRLGDVDSVDLFNLNETSGLVIHGERLDDGSGISVSGAGDVNADGIDDFLIGANGVDLPGKGNAGKGYVVFGSPIPRKEVLELSGIDGSNGVVFNGAEAGEQSGFSVSSAGDVNADGIADILIAAPYADPGFRRDAGRVYVVFGAMGLGNSGAIELSNLNGTNGFVINGQEAGDNCGLLVSYVNDINADGIDDIVIGAWQADPLGRRDAGKTYVVFGKVGIGRMGSLELSKLDGADGVVFNGEKSGDYSGYAVSGGGDINADGTADLLIGAFAADLAAGQSVGKSYVVFGRKDLGGSSSFELSKLNGTHGFILHGEQPGDQCGATISGAGDINGDKIRDFLIGANHANPGVGRENAGKVYVVFGERDLGSNGVLELSTLNGTNGFRIDGARAHDWLGGSVSRVGDMNRDGIDDLLVGAWRADHPAGVVDSGAAYVIFGRNLGPPTTSSTMTSTASTTTISPSVGITPTQHSSRLSTQRVSEVSNASVAITTRKTPAENPGGIDTTGLIFGLLGGLCALVSAMGGAVFWRKRQQKREPSMEAHMAVVGDADNGHIYASIQPREPHYSNLTSQPETHDHYIGIDVVNRQHDEYESARMQRMQQHYDDVPQF